MKYQIFISYRREGGAALAYLLNEKLSALGYKVFYDIESLDGGKFDEKLLDVIESCKDVIVVLSRHSLDRCADEGDWVRKEVAHAIKKGKNIIPILDLHFDWPDNMPDDIKDLQYYDGVPVSYKFFPGIIEQIEKKMDDSKALSTSDANNPDMKHILAWSDFDNGTLGKIIKRMKLPENYYVEMIVDPIEIVSKNLEMITAIMIFDTDVTKFANNNVAIERINDALVNYVEEGGRLIATHDSIYRRTRNTKLQNMFGCKITNFAAKDEVRYIKTEDSRDLDAFHDVPDEFVLHDAEICWGNLAPDVNVLYEDEEGHPLVFAREYGKGVCIWLNSGDFKDYPSTSLAKPEKELVRLLNGALNLQY